MTGTYRDNIYRERAELVAYLSRVFPAHLWDNPGDPDWPVVYINSPAGQLSWHIAQDDLDLFGHLPTTDISRWDGHTTEQKYDRLRKLGHEAQP